MTIDQALQLIAALIQAVIKAIETGEPNVDLLSALRSEEHTSELQSQR